MSRDLAFEVERCCRSGHSEQLVELEVYRQLPIRSMNILDGFGLNCRRWNLMAKIMAAV